MTTVRSCGRYSNIPFITVSGFLALDEYRRDPDLAMNSYSKN